jgi:D-ribose pyranase
VLRGLLEEIVVDGGVAASEVVASNEECHRLLTSLVQPLELVPHEAFKALTRRARLVVRTGEDRPYANVGLRCGVPF